MPLAGMNFWSHWSMAHLSGGFGYQLLVNTKMDKSPVFVDSVVVYRPLFWVLLLETLIRVVFRYILDSSKDI